MNACDTRVGLGYDIHRLIPGRRLVLGGVELTFELGLEGHSDGDVLVHAVMDALLGAAGLDDIGFHFPDTDQRWANASSLNMLTEVQRLLMANRWSVINVDVTLIADAPKIRSRVMEMRRLMGARLELQEDRVSVKATTSEGVGPVGRGEAMSAYAIALISRT